MSDQEDAIRSAQEMGAMEAYSSALDAIKIRTAMLAREIERIRRGETSPTHLDGLEERMAALQKDMEILDKLVNEKLERMEG
jgi:hypothetical protein